MIIASKGSHGLIQAQRSAGPTATARCRFCGTERAIVKLTWTTKGGECKDGCAAPQQPTPDPPTKAVSAPPAAPPPAKPPAAVTRDQSEKREKGWGAARYIQSLVAGKGDPESAARHAEKVLRDLQVAKALQANSGSGAGLLIPEVFASEIIELLQPRSVVRLMGATIVPMPGGNRTWPSVTSGAAASFMAEGDYISETSVTFGNLKLTGRKIGGFIPVSNSLIRFANPSADALIAQELVRAVARAENAELIRGTGTGAGPKGLRYLAPSANVITVNATVNLANIDADLGKADQALTAANVAMIKPGWLMAPRTATYLRALRGTGGAKAFPEMDQGLLKGYPFAITTQIPTDLAVTGTGESEVYLADFNDVVIGEGPIEVRVSATGTYRDATGNLISCFHADKSVIQVIRHVDIGMRHDSSVAVLSDVDWF